VSSTATTASLGRLTMYFLKLGTIGFGGPVALVGFMHRDLVERRRWITEDTYRLALAFAQIMPGPLAAQCAIALGYFEHGLLGARSLDLRSSCHRSSWSSSCPWRMFLRRTVVDAGHLLRHRCRGDCHHRHCRLQASAERQQTRSPVRGIFGALAIVTLLTRAELAVLFVVAGLLVLVIKAPPTWLKRRVPALARTTQAAFLLPFMQIAPAVADATHTSLIDILLFFAKAGAFVFGSGLAIIPFLYQGVVQDFHWLNEQQFTDAVAVAMITTGPVVITVAFVGFLVAGFAGAAVAAIGIFLPVYVPVLLRSPWFKRHRDNAQLRGFVQGATAARRERSPPRCSFSVSGRSSTCRPHS
jgi:chromate transporter